MSDETALVLENALHLPRPDRAFLAERLLESLDMEEDFPISEAWSKEIAHRCEQIDRGDVVLVPAGEAFQKAFG